MAIHICDPMLHRESGPIPLVIDLVLVLLILSMAVTHLGLGLYGVRSTCRLLIRTPRISRVSNGAQIAITCP